jgi:hypothetical protein
LYLETHWDLIVAEKATLRQAWQFFERQGLRAAGEITVSGGGERAKSDADERRKTRRRLCKRIHSAWKGS